MAVKKAVQNGNVEDAIEKVNDLNPEVQCFYISCVNSCHSLLWCIKESKSDSSSNPCLQILDTNPELFFHLQQQRLIELIRQGKTDEALEFAQEELAPRGEENVSLCFSLCDNIFTWIFVVEDGVFHVKHLCIAH